jgi:NAD(P)-dependent dehydrogenase (short-subunit alcohol dehydrogenase family)
VRVPLAELAVSNGLFPGLAGVVKMLAEELGPSGTRVNGILPVRVATDRVRQLDAVSGDPDEVRARKSEEIPLRRYGEPATSREVPDFRRRGTGSAQLLSPRLISRRGSSLLNDCGHGCGLRDKDRMAGRNLVNR